MQLDAPPLRTPFLAQERASWPWARWFSSVSAEVSKAPALVAVPASATAPGVPGQMAFSSTHLYICVAANVWRRVGISSW